jgi:hypothetical protein
MLTWDRTSWVVSREDYLRLISEQCANDDALTTILKRNGISESIVIVSDDPVVTSYCSGSVEGATGYLNGDSAYPLPLGSAQENQETTRNECIGGTNYYDATVTTTGGEVVVIYSRSGCASSWGPIVRIVIRSSVTRDRAAELLAQQLRS